MEQSTDVNIYIDVSFLDTLRYSLPMGKGSMLCIALVILIGPLCAQVKDDAPTIPIHKKGDKHIYFDPRIKYIFAELKDSLSVQKLKDKGNYFSNYLAKPPLKLKEFTFFNQNLSTFQQKKDQLKTGDHSFFDIYFPVMNSDFFVEPSIYPPSLRFYADTNTITSDPRSGMITVTEKPILEKYIEPFYFKNYEVTNAEYHEFVNWVRDSVARRLFSNAGNENYIIGEGELSEGRLYPDPPPLRWDERIHWDSKDTSYQAVLKELYLPQRERFYPRKEIDIRKLNYAWYYSDNREGQLRIMDSLEWPGINCYPDTLCWVHDFLYSSFEPLTDNYFWHPAYDNYPVVGLTYLQILAYLNWKEKMMQQDLDDKHIKYRIELKLPSEIEWEIVSTAEMKDGTIETYTKNAPYIWDENWLTDLQMTFGDYETDTIKPVNDSLPKTIIHSKVEIAKLMRWDEKNFSLRYKGNYFYTCPADLSSIDNKRKNLQIEIDLDPVGISSMGGNVSEWMDNVRDESWIVLFRKRQELLLASGFKEAKMVEETEKFYESFNFHPVHSGSDPNFKPNNSRLIRGGNWFDERYSNKYNKNVAGTNAKCFKEDSGLFISSTVGFRYIIKIYPK